MTIEKAEKVNWLNVAGLLWLGIGLASILPAGFLLLFFDKPSPNWNANNLYIDSLISFPIVCIGISIGIWFVKNKYKKWFIMLPVLPIIFFFAALNWMNVSSNMSSCGKSDCSVPLLKERDNATNVGECTLPVVDGGDGLETTGCGLLILGPDGVVTGIINGKSEAHNWQLFTQNGDEVITEVEDNGKPCLEINVLDSTGKIIKPLLFKPDDAGLVRFFSPTKDKNVYFFRLFTLKPPCTYWLQVR